MRCVSSRSILMACGLCFHSYMSAISKVVKFLQAMYDSEHFSFNVRIACFCLSEKFASILDRTLILKERCTEATCGGVYLDGDWLCAIKVFKRIGRCDCLLDLPTANWCSGPHWNSLSFLVRSQRQADKDASCGTNRLRNCTIPRKV